ncbi:MAG: hypothetical protein MZU79_05370 [Anaerotruncus sp.]|nr:hypothetical protein [Anaerotruncus sp.]
MNPYERRIVHIVANETPGRHQREHRRRVPEEGQGLQEPPLTPPRDRPLPPSSWFIRTAPRPLPSGGASSSRMGSRTGCAMLEDTIIAIATPPGFGGLGIVRISGPKAAGRRRDGSSSPKSGTGQAFPVTGARSSGAIRDPEGEPGPRRGLPDLFQGAAVLYRGGRRRAQRPRQPGRSRGRPRGWGRAPGPGWPGPGNSP